MKKGKEENIKKQSETNTSPKKENKPKTVQLDNNNLTNNDQTKEDLLETYLELIECYNNSNETEFNKILTKISSMNKNDEKINELVFLMTKYSQENNENYKVNNILDDEEDKQINKKLKINNSVKENDIQSKFYINSEGEYSYDDSSEDKEN